MPPSPSAQATFEETKAARQLLAEAPAILQDVDASPMLQRHSRRYPTLERAEVQVGPLLGSGGYCCVHEVSDFSFVVTRMMKGAEETKKVGTEDEEVKEDKNQAEEEVIKVDKGRFGGVILPDHDEHEDHPHYHVDTARQLMKDHVRRNGEARYAIKRLKSSLSGVEHVRGKIDLAIEAKYLSSLWHPNIVKMRAVCTGDFLDPNFFIVMDRLFDTLAVRIKSWKETHKKFKGGLFGRGANKGELQALTTERMIVAYDLSSAFRYMHDNKLVYRDIRKENIGFDVRGDVKVFDFGLSKTLSPSLQAKDANGRVVYGYNLTPRTGSIPFMAPEVVERKPYDTKCDVFSFAILLWEIMALKPAYGRLMRPADYRQRIVFQGERPSLDRNWPSMTRQLIKESWDEDPQKRPNMKRVAAMLRGELNEMTTASDVQNRTRHMRDRSAHSMRLEGRARKIILDSTDETTPNNGGHDEEDAKHTDEPTRSNDGDADEMDL